MPPVLEKEQTLERPPTKHRHGFGRRLLISTIRFVVIMLLAAMIGGGIDPNCSESLARREMRKERPSECHIRLLLP